MEGRKLSVRLLERNFIETRRFKLDFHGKRKTNLQEKKNKKKKCRILIVFTATKKIELQKQGMHFLVLNEIRNGSVVFSIYVCDNTHLSLTLAYATTNNIKRKHSLTFWFFFLNFKLHNLIRFPFYSM